MRALFYSTLDTILFGLGGAALFATAHFIWPQNYTLLLYGGVAGGIGICVGLFFALATQRKRTRGAAPQNGQPNLFQEIVDTPVSSAEIVRRDHGN